MTWTSRPPSRYVSPTMGRTLPLLLVLLSSARFAGAGSSAAQTFVDAFTTQLASNVRADLGQAIAPGDPPPRLHYSAASGVPGRLSVRITAPVPRGATNAARKAATRVIAKGKKTLKTTGPFDLVVEITRAGRRLLHGAQGFTATIRMVHQIRGRRTTQTAEVSIP